MDEENNAGIGIFWGLIFSAPFWVIVACIYLQGCALRVSVTPIQAEELVQKSVTNQFFDWIFKGEDHANTTK